MAAFRSIRNEEVCLLNVRWILNNNVQK
jgi:hypothetical protein